MLWLVALFVVLPLAELWVIVQVAGEIGALWTLLAMTAAGVDALSGGRCVLGLGASGPQVIEGFHGVAYEHPMPRIREYIEVCRMVWRREPVVYDGQTVQIPLPAG